MARRQRARRLSEKTGRLLRWPRVEPAPDLDELSFVEAREALVAELGQPALALVGRLETEEVLLDVRKVCRRKIRACDQLFDRDRLAPHHHLAAALLGVLLDHRRR